MARIGFTILLDLQDYFSDDRQHSKIYINTKCSKISDLENKISELFGIKRFHLLSEGHFLPASEDIALLKNGETIRVKPNIPKSQSILLADTYYDANNAAYKRINLSEETIPVRAKKRKTLFEDNDETVEEVPVVEEKYEQQCMHMDHSNNKSHELHTSTPSNIEAKHNNMKSSLSNSMKNQKKSKMNKNEMDNSKSEIVKPIKNEHRESELTEASLEKSISYISQSQNETTSKHFQTEDEPFTRPIPCKKAKLKSWSNSPLKTTNIVQIIKTPIDRIEIDLSRFDFIPNDDLPPLKPIDIEKNTLAENLEGDLSIKSQEYSEELQNFANESKTECNIELMEGHEELTEADPQSLPEMLDINSLKGSISRVMKNEKDSEKSKRFEPSDSVATSKKLMKLKNNCSKSPNIPNISTQLLSLNCVTEAEQFKAQNGSPELQPTEVMNSFDLSEQNIHSENCPKNESTELIQPQNLINQIKPWKSNNFADSSQQVSDVSQTKAQNMSDLSKQSSMGNSLEVATTLEQAKKAIRWSCQENKKSELSQNNVKESRCTSRERWRRKIENLTKDLLSKSDNSEKLSIVTHNSLNKNNSDQIEKTNGLLNINENQIIFSHNKNSLENDEVKNTEYILKDDSLANKEKIKNTVHINNCEMNFSNENFKPTYGTETVSGSTISRETIEGIKEYTESCLTEDTNINNEIIERTDDINNVRKKLSCENFSNISEISLDSTISHETTADDAAVLNPRRRRRKRYRKKTKVEKAPAREEKINAFPPHWVEFVPAKPKIHLRFNSSDDDVSQEVNENVMNQSATSSTDKIKILQDVTINPDRNFPVLDVDSKVAVKSVGQDELLADTYAENTEYCEPSEFSNDGNDIQMLLQQKKEELLRTVDSFTLIH